MNRYVVICLASAALMSCTPIPKPDPLREIHEQIETARKSRDVQGMERLGHELMKEIERQIEGARDSRDLQKMNQLCRELFTYREGNPRERVREQFRVGAVLWQAFESMAVLTPEERTRELLLGDNGDTDFESAYDRKERKRQIAEEKAFHARASKQWVIDRASDSLRADLWLLGIREYSASEADKQRLREDLAPFPEPVREEVIEEVETWRRTGRR
jgi:hypothetical protein